MISSSAIPITTIGGYLGAGKTTLLNGILAGNHRRRIGVLVNDFGSVSIDERLIVSRDGEVVALANGCACCSVAGDLGQSLDKLAQLTLPPEHILVETSGVADPARVAELARSPGFEPRATVVLVDSETIVDRANDKFVGRLVRKQLAGAHLLVLNKIDLVDSTQLSAAKGLVTREASGVRVIEMCHADVDPNVFLEWTGTLKSGFVCERTDDNSDIRFESYHWITDSMVNLPKLTDAIVALDPNIIRVKGVITHQGQDWGVHRVGNRMSVEPLTAAACSSRTELTFIARLNSLDRSQIDSIFNSCISADGSQHNA